jgi:hypothetical protein
MATLVAYALTTVADVKESLGIASSDHTKDNLITRKINQVTDLIQTYCGRNFTLQQYIEYADGSNTDQIVLKQRPVVADASHAFLVEQRGSTLNDEDFETIPADLFFLDATAGVVDLDYIASGRWDRYRYTYYAGYATIPNDLAEAANMLACYFTTNPAGARIGVVQVKEGQRETRYSNSSTNSSLSFRSIAEQLGIDTVLDSYSNLPLLTGA